MARAHSVYLVQAHDMPIAAFTVKHECRTWLLKNYERCPEWLKVWRLPDGRLEPDGPVHVTGELYQFPKLKSHT